jgi:coenzyme F420-reducing hydrogenase delta subunit
LLRPFLDYLGVEKERFWVEWVSASEGKRWSQVVSSFTEELRRMGPRKAAMPQEVVL